MKAFDQKIFPNFKFKKKINIKNIVLDSGPGFSNSLYPDPSTKPGSGSRFGESVIRNHPI
jgi:hypothetical protein